MHEKGEGDTNKANWGDIEMHVLFFHCQIVEAKSGYVKNVCYVQKCKNKCPHVQLHRLPDLPFFKHGIILSSLFPALLPALYDMKVVNEYAFLRTYFV